MIISRNVATWLSNAIFFMRIEKLLHIPLFRAHKLYMATQRRRLVLVNSHPSIEWERPLPPNVRYVGPPFLAKARAPSHVSSPDFILVSLGTFVSMDAGEYWELARALEGGEVGWIAGDVDLCRPAAVGPQIQPE